eukprot:scaffold85869_cov51-Phaeocystis_antarctica.AAC.2
MPPRHPGGSPQAARATTAERQRAAERARPGPCGGRSVARRAAAEGGAAAVGRCAQRLWDARAARRAQWLLRAARRRPPCIGRAAPRADEARPLLGVDDRRVHARPCAGSEFGVDAGFGLGLRGLGSGLGLGPGLG